MRAPSNALVLKTKEHLGGNNGVNSEQEKAKGTRPADTYWEFTLQQRAALELKLKDQLRATKEC